MLGQSRGAVRLERSKGQPVAHGWNLQHTRANTWAHADLGFSCEDDVLCVATTTPTRMWYSMVHSKTVSIGSALNAHTCCHTQSIFTVPRIQVEIDHRCILAEATLVSASKRVMLICCTMHLIQHANVFFRGRVHDGIGEARLAPTSASWVSHATVRSVTECGPSKSPNFVLRILTI